MHQVSVQYSDVSSLRPKSKDLMLPDICVLRLINQRSLACHYSLIQFSFSPFRE